MFATENELRVAYYVDTCLCAGFRGFVRMYVDSRRLRHVRVLVGHARAFRVSSI